MEKLDEKKGAFHGPLRIAKDYEIDFIRKLID